MIQRGDVVIDRSRLEPCDGLEVGAELTDGVVAPVRIGERVAPVPLQLGGAEEGQEAA